MNNAVASGCGGCEGRCCSFYIVPVTGQDVWRIVQAQRLDPLLFVQSQAEETPTEHGFLLRPNGPTYGLSLQHHQTRHKERVCVFLLHLRDGVKRCGMYPHRPRACQTYSMHTQEDRVLARADMLCPKGSWQQHNQQEAYWQGLLDLQEAEWQRYRVVVECWNAHIRSYGLQHRFTLQQYLEYLLNAYDVLDAGLEQQASNIQDALAVLVSAYIPA